MIRTWGLLLLALALTVSVPAQLPATGLKTDVMQTSQGELHITPLRRNSFVMTWFGREIYIDPQRAADFRGWPKADLILITGAHADPQAQAAVEALRKATTRILVPVPLDRLIRGSKVTLAGIPASVTLPGLGIAIRVNVQALPYAGGDSYLLALGHTQLFISGNAPCLPTVRELRNIAVAFIAVGPARNITPKAAADCVRAFHPRIVYPYLAQGNAAQVFAQVLAGEKGIDVRIRDWQP